MTNLQQIAKVSTLFIAFLHEIAPLAAQDFTKLSAEIHYEVQSSRTIPLEGRTLTIQRVNPLVLSPSEPVAPPLLAIGQLAAHSPTDPVPKETKLLLLTVTRYAENLSYIEWQLSDGDTQYAAWSSADFEALSTLPEVEVIPGNIRYVILPFSIRSYEASRGSVPVAPPQLPADGPGFVIVRGNAADEKNVNPVAALHKVYKDDGAALKRARTESERLRKEEETRRLSDPPPPPQNAVIRFWPVKSQRYTTSPSASSASTSVGQ